MPNTKITKQKLKDHWSYSKKVYIAGALCAILVCNLLYSMTRYQAPNERSVYIAMVDSYTMPDKVSDIVPALLAAGQEEDSALEIVQFNSISYSGSEEATSENDYYGAQVYMVQIYAGDNDIYLQNLRLTNDLIAQNYCYPLETLSAFDDFVAKYPGVQILWDTEASADSAAENEEEEPAILADLPQHAYAIDISTLTGLADRGSYNNKDKYACIVLGSGNPETSFEVLAAMFDLLSAPEAAQ